VLLFLHYGGKAEEAKGPNFAGILVRACKREGKSFYVAYKAVHAMHRKYGNESSVRYANKELLAIKTVYAMCNRSEP